MTCIVGFVDKINNCVWIGGDSCGSDGYTQTIVSTPKVFHNKKDIIFGGTSTFRHLDLLHYSDELFEEEYEKINHEYMVIKFIPKVHKLFDSGIFNAGTEKRGGNFLVGIKDKLFEVQNDYSVLESKTGYNAVGCGEVAALGSLFTTEKMNLSPVERITLALKSAENVNTGVKRPFHIINTMNEKTVIIK